MMGRRPPPRYTCRKSLTRGLTLIEVMVALTIVAVTLVAGMKASSALVNNTQRLADITLAQWCADNKLNEMRLNRIFPDVGDTESQCEQLGRTFTVQLGVRPTPNPNFRRADVRIVSDTAQPIVQLSTILPGR